MDTTLSSSLPSKHEVDQARSQDYTSSPSYCHISNLNIFPVLLALSSISSQSLHVLLDRVSKPQPARAFPSYAHLFASYRFKLLFHPYHYQVNFSKFFFWLARLFHKRDSQQTAFTRLLHLIRHNISLTKVAVPPVCVKQLYHSHITTIHHATSNFYNQQRQCMCDKHHIITYPNLIYQTHHRRMSGVFWHI